MSTYLANSKTQEGGEPVNSTCDNYYIINCEKRGWPFVRACVYVLCVYVCDRSRDALPVARQHRFVDHRDEEGTSGVKKSGKELEVSRVVNSLLAAFGRHSEEGKKETKSRREGNKVVSWQFLV